MKTLSIAVVAGRSGGHIIPAITLAKQHKNNIPDLQILFMSTATELDYALIGKHTFIGHHVPFSLDNVPSRIWHYPYYCCKLGSVFMKSFFILKKYRPKKIISTGGYISLPICLAAHLLGIPIELYELNAEPGKAIAILAPLATNIFTPFESTKKKLSKYNALVCPYPIKFNLSSMGSHAIHIGNKRSDILATEKKTVLILGGSQGSVFINEAIKRWVQKNSHLHSAIQIIHQTGSATTFDYQTLYYDNKIPAYVFDYNDDMAPYYKAADLIICRAGAGTLFEALFFRKSCIVIPLETKTTNHQRDNALQLEKQHPDLITILDQQKLQRNPKLLDEAINSLLLLANHQAVFQNQ